MKQLHFSNTFIPISLWYMTYKEWQMVLESHMFLKENQNGNIKVWTLAGGNKHISYITKEDAILTTFATEYFLLTIIIDAEVNRDTTVIDILKAFIHMCVKVKKDMSIINICGVLVDTLCKISPK